MIVEWLRETLTSAPFINLEVQCDSSSISGGRAMAKTEAPDRARSIGSIIVAASGTSKVSLDSSEDGLCTIL
jgi:hypothetical protein